MGARGCIIKTVNAVHYGILGCDAVKCCCGSSIILEHQRHSQKGPLKWYPTTTLHSIIIQENLV